MAYIQTRQPDRARETWARAFRVPPDSAAAHLVAAQMMVRAEMEEMAQAELTAALKKDPRLPHAHLLLGQAALFRGRLDEAIALSTRSSKRIPATRRDWSQAIVGEQRWQSTVMVDRKTKLAIIPAVARGNLSHTSELLAGPGMHDLSRRRASLMTTSL